MDFNFTEEQVMLRDTVASWLQDNYDFDKRHAAIKGGKGERDGAWKAYAEELGILGASFSEDLGGLGGGATETMVVMEEFGKALALEDFTGAVVAAGGFIKHAGWSAGAALAEEIIAGTARPAFAYAEHQARYTWHDLKTTAKKSGDGYVLNGHKAVVVGGPTATHFIVSARTGGAQRDRDGVAVFLVDKGAKGLVTRDYPNIDGPAASEVFFENVEIPAENLIGEGLELLERVIDEATVASLAEACGVLQKLHELTLEYTKTRKQFGQPIAQFQALQHRMVDMMISWQQAVSMTYMATIKVTYDDATERAKAVSAAKVQVTRALKFVGENAIQLHGGMGMTEEMPVSHYFKRGTILRNLFGGEDFHIRRYEALSLGKAA